MDKPLSSHDDEVTAGHESFRSLVNQLTKHTQVESALLAHIGSQPLDALAVIENIYTVSFGTKVDKLRDRGTTGERKSSREELTEHIASDISEMTSQIPAIARRDLADEIVEPFPSLDSGVIAFCGAAAHFDERCMTCAGSAVVTCTGCAGSGKQNCTQCQFGKKQCPSCHGTTSANSPCYSCGGTRGSYSAPATYDHQYQNDTWDWQKRQTAQGGQWKPCATCGGSGTQKTHCHACIGGTVTCSACNGSGQVTCARCGGSGKITCQSCSNGYNHYSYLPQVSIRHEHSLNPVEGQSDEQLNIIKLATSNIRTLSRQTEAPSISFDQIQSTIIRTHTIAVPCHTHTVEFNNNHYSALVSALTGSILDYGGLSVAILNDDKSELEQARTLNQIRSAFDQLVASSAVKNAVDILTTAIGAATVSKKFGAPTEQQLAKISAASGALLTLEFLTELKSILAQKVRVVLSKTHAIALTIACLLLAGYGLLQRLDLKIYVEHQRAVILLSALLPAIGADIAAVTPGLVSFRPFSRQRMSNAILATKLILLSPVHWAFIALYVALASVALSVLAH